MEIAKKLEKEIALLEEEIETLEQKKTATEAQLALPEVFENLQKLQEVNQIYAQIQAQLAEKNNSWEEKMMQLDE
mgnify:FL=1